MKIFSCHENPRTPSSDRTEWQALARKFRQYFRPEFLNPLDEIIVFRQPIKEEVKEIAEIMLRDVFKPLTEKEITLEVSDRFKERWVDEGFNPAYGSRPLRRAIVRLLEDVFAEEILCDRLSEGDTALVDVNEEGKVTVKPVEQRELLTLYIV